MRDRAALIWDARACDEACATRLAAVASWHSTASRSNSSRRELSRTIGKPSPVAPRRVAEAARALVQAVDARGQPRAQPLPHVERGAAMVERADHQPIQNAEAGELGDGQLGGVVGLDVDRPKAVRELLPDSVCAIATKKNSRKR